MKPAVRNYSDNDIAVILRERGVTPTVQRVAITREIFARCTHISAEEVFHIVNAGAGGAGRKVSKATVYNTLGLLAEKGVIRQVIADPTKVFYDPNTAPHHHFYDEETGELTDINADQVKVMELPPLPQGKSLQGVDVIIRLRRSHAAH